MESISIFLSALLVLLILSSVMLTNWMGPTSKCMPCKFMIDIFSIVVAVILGTEFYCLTQQVSS